MVFLAPEVTTAERGRIFPLCRFENVSRGPIRIHRGSDLDHEEVRQLLRKGAILFEGCNDLTFVRTKVHPSVVHVDDVHGEYYN